MLSKDFHSYRNILAIDPGYSFKNGAGYAIFDDETFRLKACGVVKPFAPGLTNLYALDEISSKLRRIWENKVGFSYDPAHLIIEGQQVYPFSKINNDPLIKLARLTGILIRDYKTPEKHVYIPSASEWKGRQKKADTASEVVQELDAWSKKTLSAELSSIPVHLQHNALDAVALGLWQIRKIRNTRVPETRSCPVT